MINVKMVDTKCARDLILLIETFLNGNIGHLDFVVEYEDYFALDRADITVGRATYGLLKELNTKLAFFEPLESLRKEDSDYYDEKELYNKVSETYEEIKQLNKNSEGLK